MGEVQCLHFFNPLSRIAQFGFYIRAVFSATNMDLAQSRFCISGLKGQLIPAQGK